MKSMAQQEFSPRLLSVSGATNDNMMCRWLSSRQPTIVVPEILEASGCSNSARPLSSLLKKREHPGTIDEDEQPLTPKRKGYGCDTSVVTPVHERSPSSSTDPTIVSFNPPFLQSSVQNSSLSKEDITCVFNEIQESTSSMDDEPVWDNMSDIEEDSAFATYQHPPLATRKISDGVDVDSSKVEDLPDGLFGWFTDDVIEDVEPSKSPTDVSLVSGDSSDKLSDDEELRPTVSLEDQDSPSVCKFLNVMGDIDVDMDLDGPVFEDNILDHNLSSASIGAVMFDFPMPNSPLPAAAFPPGKHLPSPAVHLTTLDPLPYSSPGFMTPALQETITSVVTPERQDSIEIMAMDLLANVATDASKELLDFATDSCFDSCSENEMMTSHQSSEKKSKKCGSAWMKKFEQLREYARENGNCNIPQKFPKNPSLGRWTARQRLFMRQCLDAQMGESNGLDTLSAQADVDERMRLLRTIGLKASPKQKETGRKIASSFRNSQDWDNRFAELLRYKSIYGDCDVPVKADGDFKSLGRWVTSQRKKYKEFHLGEYGDENTDHFLSRFRRLNEIGFKFKIGSGRGTNGRATGSKGQPNDSEVMPP